MQEADGGGRLCREGAEGHGHIAGRNAHRVAVHQHQPNALVDVHNDAGACTQDVSFRMHH